MTGIVLANNLLTRAFKEKISVTPMKLQKLLYYVCVEYLRETGALPFSEQFEVWQYGPVLPSVYAEFQSFRGGDINKFAKDSQGNVFIADENAAPDVRKALDSVWTRYKGWTAVELSRQTHLPDSAWTKANLEQRNTITKDDMQQEISNAGQYCR